MTTVGQLKDYCYRAAFIMRSLHYYFLLVLFIEFQTQPVRCKNILAVFPHMGMSHFNMYEAYVQKLAERGHTVTLVAWHNVTKIHANIKSIGIGDNSGDSFHVNLAHYEATPKILQTWTELQVLNDAGQKSCQQGLTHPKIKALCESKQKFDLVVVEYFNTDCFAVLAHLFKAPLMGIFSSPPLPWHNDRMGNPDNPSYIVSVFSGFTSQMDFTSRIKNTIGLTFAKAYHKMYYAGPAEKLIKKNFGTGIPKLADIVSTTSVFLVNSHFSLLQSRPLVPGVVEVGGLHVQPPKKLPADLDKYLSQSKKGVVYFSLGTVTLATSMPPKKMRTLLNAFGNLTHDVLWRCEEEVPNKPKNMLLKTWLPQNDVLGKYLMLKVSFIKVQLLNEFLRISKFHPISQMFKTIYVSYVV